MTVEVIAIDKALEVKGAIFVDVRSPIEFQESHIPHAINLPLFSDRERDRLGTVHREEGPHAARLLGLQYVSPKLSDIVTRLEPLTQRGNLVIYCWRGGMRSYSIGEILALLKIPCFRLLGGYKAFRKHVRSALETMPSQQVIVLHGLTGVGKTNILQILQQQGYPVIDIEKLANHRGSAFGHVGLGPQPSQGLFEGLLFWQLNALKESSYILVECESRRIGRLSLPPNLMQTMKDGKHILVYASLQKRAATIVEEYTHINITLPELENAIMKLQKQLGKAKISELITYLHQQRLSELVETLLLKYYDPLYGYESCPNTNYDFNIDASDLHDAAEALKAYCRQLDGSAPAHP